MAKRKPLPTVEELKAMLWKDYIKTTHWRKFSKSLLDPEDCCCEICGKKRWGGFYVRGKKKGKRKRLGLFNVHHKHYRNMGGEEREDVLVLCHQCHDVIHSIETLARTRGGIWEELYLLIKEKTPWEYIKFGTK